MGGVEEEPRLRSCVAVVVLPTPGVPVIMIFGRERIFHKLNAGYRGVEISSKDLAGLACKLIVNISNIFPATNKIKLELEVSAERVNDAPIYPEFWYQAYHSRAVDDSNRRYFYSYADVLVGRTATCTSA